MKKCWLCGNKKMKLYPIEQGVAICLSCNRLPQRTWEKQVLEKMRGRYDS